MKKGSQAFIAISIGMLFAGAVFAGSTKNSPVVIDSTITSSFYGSYGGARNSTNTVEYIECVDVGSLGSCTGRNANYVSKTCITTDPTHLAVIRSMSDSSWIRVRWNADGTCNNIARIISSRDEPKM